MINTVIVATVALGAASSFAAPARPGAGKPAPPQPRPQSSRTDQIGAAVGVAGVVTGVAGLFVPKPARRSVWARSPKRKPSKPSTGKKQPKPKKINQKPSPDAPNAPAGTSYTEKAGVFIDGAGLIVDVAGLVLSQYERRDVQSLEARRGPKKPSSGPARPHGSRTDQIGNVINAAGVATDIAGLVVPKDLEYETLRARRAPKKPSPAPARPQGSRTDQIGNVINAAGVATDIAGLVVPKDLEYETLQARRGPKKPSPAPARPHGSRTDQIGNVINAAGVATDIAGLVVPKDLEYETLQARRGPKKPSPAPARPQGSRTDQIGNVINAAGVATDIAGLVVPKDLEYETLQARRSPKKPSPAPARPQGSRTDQIGNVINAAGVATDIAGLVVPKDLEYDDFEARELFDDYVLEQLD